MVLVKVCGLRSAADVEAAADADLVGLVVGEPRSRRNLRLEDAADLRRKLSGPEPVAVTTRQDPGFLEAVVRDVDPAIVQIHGVRSWDGAAAVRAALPSRVRLALAVTPPFREAESIARHAQLLVLDAPGELGGSGQLHDWPAAAGVSRSLATPVFLAGGLTPENVREAIRTVRPAGVDVSSGVEGCGGKDPERVRRFLREARS